MAVDVQFVQRAEFGPFQLDLLTAELFKQGRKLRLSGKAAQLLVLLVQRAGELVTREDLRAAMWRQDTFVDFDHGLNNSVNRVREVLGDSAVLSRYVETLPKQGYRFIGSLYCDKSSVEGRKIVAVLPFRSLTRGGDEDYLNVALADALLNRLGATPNIVVRPLGVTMGYCGRNLDPLKIAAELDVDAIVEGSIHRSGSALRLYIQAWDVPTGSTLLSTKIDSDITDLLHLQDAVAKCAEGLFTSGTLPQLASVLTTSPLAFEYFLRATDRLIRGSLWDTRTAIELLELATTLDPNFAEAWSRLAGACTMMATLFEPGSKWTHRADSTVERALKADPENAETHAARARVLWTPAKRFHHGAALRGFRKALRINPRCHQALVWQGGVLFHIGLMEEAKASLVAALAISPDDSFALSFLGQMEVYLGRPEEAEKYFARNLQLYPTDQVANAFPPCAALYSDSLSKAEEKIKIAKRIIPDAPIIAGYEALLWAKRGETKKAEQAICRALKGKPFLHTHHALHYGAAAYAVLGRTKAALSLLTRACRTGLPNYIAFRDDPHFAQLKNQADFERLISRLYVNWKVYRRDFGGGRLFDSLPV